MGRTNYLAFTKRALESLPLPTRRDRENYFDEETSGLGIVVYRSGKRTFFHVRKANGYPQRTTIGPFPDLSVEQARGKASELNATLAKWKMDGCSGDNPFERRRDVTFDALFEQYVERRLTPGGSNVKHIRYLVEHYVPAPWRQRRVGMIRRADVADLHWMLGEKYGQHLANRVVQYLRAVFNFGLEAELWKGENPVRKIEYFPEVARERYLKPDELKRLFDALGDDETDRDLRDYVTLALFTAARKSDVLGMKWQDISFELKAWRVPEPKGDKPYEIPLVPQALSILQERRALTNGSQWVFPSPLDSSKHIAERLQPWYRLLRRAGLTNFRVHDLRRSAASWMAAGAVPLNVIGAGLGHRSLSATQIYARLDLTPVRNAFSTAVDAMVAAANAPPQLPAPVVPKRAKAKAARRG